MSRQKKYDPEQDGITHINIYSKGKTDLGRMLSNFAKLPVEHEGEIFQSVEGLWFYLATNHCERRDELKILSGFPAKKLGGELIEQGYLNEEMTNKNQARPSQDDYWSDNFKFLICKALENKVRQHKDLREKLKETELPFLHYYVYDGKAVMAGYKWLVVEWEILKGLAKLKMLD